MISLTPKPVAELSIVPNSPRISAGAFGVESKVSI